MPRNQLSPDAPRTPSIQWGVFGLAFVFALVLHASLLALPQEWLFSKDDIQPAKRTIIVQRLTRQPNNKRRRLRHIARSKRKLIVRRKRSKPKRRKPKPPPKLRGQIVDVAPTPDNRVPKKAKYLSEHNTNVKKETVSRHRRLKYRLAMKRVTRLRRARTQKGQRAVRGMKIRNRAASKSAGPTRQTRKGTKARKKAKYAKKMPRLQLPRVRRKRRTKLRRSKKGRYRYSERNQLAMRGIGKRFRLGVGRLKLEKFSDKPSPTKGQQGKGNPSQGSLSMLNLRPDFGTLSRLQGAPAPDKVDAPEGDETALNSRRWLYASFFNRVKQLIAQHWNPVGAYRRRDPYGNIYGVRDRSTSLKIELKPDGSILKLGVLTSCGLSFLDKEALRAVRAAQPFPNPPKALVTGGKISFRFGFTLTLSSRPGFSLFRQ